MVVAPHTPGEPFILTEFCHWAEDKGAGMKNLKLWPHVTLFALLCAVLAGLGVALWMKHEQTASAEALPNAALIQRVDGDVMLNNGMDGNTANGAADSQWVAASPNQPFSVGDRIYTREGSRASLALTGRNFVRLNPSTSLDVLSLDSRNTQLALRDGSAMFDVGYLEPGQLYEVATPYGAVDLNQPGLYNVGIDQGNVIVSVLSGLAQVVGLGGSGQISKGEVLTLVGQTAADVVLSRINGRDAGYLVNDYYGYQYPQYYDGRYSDYNTYLNDPYYFDPYRRDASYQYASQYIPGLNDLDYYGSWQNVSGYGYCWTPRVDSGWAPYQQGSWVSDYPYGPTWVSSEPWGYAPYHYGRWANVGNQWYWIPDAVNTTPSYSPALVAFLPIGQNDIGWVPLGPGDPYAPRYYDRSWQPTYLNRTRVVQDQVVNLNIPGAVTVIPVDDFSRGDWRHFRRADRAMLAQVRPVLDPLTLTPLRNAVVHSAWGRGKKDLPPGIAKKLDETAVVTSAAPVAPPFRRDLRQSLRVQSVPDKVKGQKFKVRDERQNVGTDQAPMNQRGPEQKPNVDVDRRLREAQQQQQPGNQPEQPRGQAKRQMRAEQPARVEQPRIQGERVGQPVRVERKQKVERPQAPTNAPGPERVRQPQPQPPARVDRAPKQERAPRPQAAPQPRMAGRGNPAAQPQGNGHGQQNAARKQQGPAAQQSQPKGNGKGEGKPKKP
jgi:hypothetical protein